MKDQSYEELLRELSEGIRTSAELPNINAYQPHDKQRVFHSSTSKARLYIGGNRGGKTVGGATEAIWWLTGTHPFQETPRPPVRGRCISVDFTNGVEAIVKPEIKRWIAPSMLINGSWEESYNMHTRTLTLANGSFLEFKSYDQDLDKHAGTSRHFVWFDEEPPHSIFEENMMRLMDTDGHWWLTMTPVEGYTWVAEEIYEPAVLGLTDTTVVKVNTNDNPHLNTEAINRAMSYLSEEDQKARQEGDFIVQGGLIFKDFDATVHVTDKILINPKNPKHRVIASMDLGIANPTAWLWHCVNDDGVVFTFHEEYDTGLTIPQWARRVKEYESKLRRVPELRVGDPSIVQRSAQTGLSNRVAYSQQGIYIALGNNDVDASILKMMSYLQHDEKMKPMWYIHSSCRNLIKELRRYQNEDWATRKQKDKNNKKEKPRKKDDHAVDACRYLFSFLPDLAREQVKEDKRFLNESISRQLSAKKVVNMMAPILDEALLRPNKPQTEWEAYDEYMGSEW
jgi:phage terminase large subunit-like protein